EVETLEHVTICSALEANWKRIEALTGETAWNSLISDAKYKVDPQTIMKIIFKSRAEDIGITRLNLTKSLIKQSVVNNLNELLSIYKDARNTEKRKGITKQFKLFAHYRSPSTSTKKKQLHKINVGPRNGSGLGSSKVFINTGIQQGSRNEDSTP
ncbi:7026_t:CDS:2, partial [Gigaspora margarita]